MKESFSLLLGFWHLFLEQPLWFHILFSIPFGIFILGRITIPLVNSIVVGSATGEATMPNQLIQKKNKPVIVREVKESSAAITEQRLRDGFNYAKSEEGLKYLTKLEEEYKGLRYLLDNSSIEDTVLNLKRISKLTSDLYQQGLNFLSQALNITQQLSTSSREDLITENKELKTELEKCKPDSTIHKLVTERLSHNAKSLSKVKEFREKLDEYFCQVGLCRDSIREVRLGIPELLGNKPKDEFDKAMLELRTRVELAQRVQAEYTRQGI